MELPTLKKPSFSADDLKNNARKKFESASTAIESFDTTEIKHKTRQRLASANSVIEDKVDGGFFEICMPEKIMRVRVCRAFSALIMSLVFLFSFIYFFQSDTSNCPMVTVETNDKRCTSQDMWMWSPNQWHHFFQKSYMVKYFPVTQISPPNKSQKGRVSTRVLVLRR